jgi:hypothetical protein
MRRFLTVTVTVKRNASAAWDMRRFLTVTVTVKRSVTESAQTFL